MFRKKILPVIAVLFLIFLCSAKNIDDSFDHYYIAFAVEDTTSLNATYEKPIHRMLKLSGHTVRLAYADSLDSDNAIGTQDWDTFDLAVIPNFVVCPTVDTTKKIGDIPVIVLEDSLWDDFGFIPSGAKEPYLWIADYGNKRIVKTKWDGDNWKSYSTGNRNPQGMAFDKTGWVGTDDTTSIYLSFRRASAACDTLFKTTWGFGSYTTYGATGTGNYQFTRPEQLYSINEGDLILVADGGNKRFVKIMWGDGYSVFTVKKTDDTTRGISFNHYSDSDILLGNDKIFRLYYGGHNDSTELGSTAAGYVCATDSVIYIANGQEAPNGKIWRMRFSTMTVTDSLYGSKIGQPFGLFFDEITSYLYWTDTAGNEIKRAKFDGTADGASLDSCFASGSGVNQLSLPKGLLGYSYSTPTITDDDSIYISNVTDSITSILSTGIAKGYKSNGSLSGMDIDEFFSSNILAEDVDETQAIVVIDTLNNKKRIAFGLYEVSKLGLPYASGGTVDTPDYYGWELFNRSIGRLKESEQDSIFNLGYVTSDEFISTSADTSKIGYLQSNMHRVTLVSNFYANTYDYSETGGNWEDFDLVIIACELTYGADSLRETLISNKKPLIVTKYSATSSFDDGFFSSLPYDSCIVDVDSLVLATVLNAHPIADSLSLTGDIELFSENFPIDVDFNDFGAYITETTDSAQVVTVVRATINDGSVRKYRNILVASRLRYWVFLNLEYPLTVTPYTAWGFDYFGKNLLDLWEESLTYVLDASTIFAPSAVTVTQHTADSLIVAWTDNSLNESGFNIYLTPGGSYSGDDIIVKTTAADVEGDTLGIFWPPSGVFYLDVGSFSDVGGARSGVPDSAMTLPRNPQRPIVYALSDTAINILLNGYIWYDLFNSALMPGTWYWPYGEWETDLRYKRLRTWGVVDTFLTRFKESRSVSFDGVNDYASIPDKDSLDVGSEDYMYSFWFKLNSLDKEQRVINKRVGMAMHDVHFGVDNKINVEVSDGTHYIHIESKKDIGVKYLEADLDVNIWHQCTIIMDRDSLGYIFFDSIYDTASSISVADYNASNTAPFVVGRYDPATTHYLDGKLSDMRFFRFGRDGLTITGTHAGNNLLIKTKDDTIYSKATNQGVVKSLYDKPLCSLDSLGYDELYDARGMECFNDGDFSDSTKWSKLGTSGFLSFKDSVVTINFDVYTVLVFYQTAANRVDSLVPDHYYMFEYEVISNNIVGTPTLVQIFTFTTGDGAKDITDNLSVGIHNVLLKSSSTTETDSIGILIADLGNASGSIVFDNLSLKSVGEVAWWKFDESGTLDTLVDQSSNNLDLITYNSPVSLPSYYCTSVEPEDDKDLEWSFKYHFNDSLRLNRQWVRLVFNSSDSIGEGNGYTFYADSSLFRVYKQTSNVYVDTLIDTTWTGDYKWHTLLVQQDWQQYPANKDIDYSVYLDNSLMGTFSDTTYVNNDWIVLQASHRRQWYDNFWLKNNSPGANDETYTEYAIIDSTSGQYLQSDHTFGAAAYWDSWADWGTENGFYAKMSPFTSKKIRIIARNKR